MAEDTRDAGLEVLRRCLTSLDFKLQADEDGHAVYVFYDVVDSVIRSWSKHYITRIEKQFCPVEGRDGGRKVVCRGVLPDRRHIHVVIEAGEGRVRVADVEFKTSSTKTSLTVMERKALERLVERLSVKKPTSAYHDLISSVLFYLPNIIENAFNVKLSEPCDFDRLSDDEIKLSDPCEAKYSEMKARAKTKGTYICLGIVGDEHFHVSSRLNETENRLGLGLSFRVESDMLPRIY